MERHFLCSTVNGDLEEFDVVASFLPVDEQTLAEFAIHYNNMVISVPPEGHILVKDLLETPAESHEEREVAVLVFRELIVPSL
jgi:hypothetical protein